MLLYVYGTLKRGHHNNVLLAHAQFLEERVIPGYKLLDAGFPVAWPDENSSILVEVYDIGDDKFTLMRLDRLEAEGRMYHRTKVDDGQMYVGNPDYWREDHMEESTKNLNGVFEYHRYRNVN
jgi:gamma-glutamylcyclotransferase (GGCT)/AIG2-like uncharacterized protein YtfP